MSFTRPYLSVWPLSPAIRNFILVFLGALLLHVAGTWTIPLIDRDEPRFAEASREMRERGDYVIPYFNDKYRFDKPPWIYWTQIASYRVFGENDFAARLPSAVAAALTALLLFVWGRRLGGERIGWWAAIIFILCLQTFMHAKAAVADMWLVFFVTAAHWAGFELLADSLGRRSPALGRAGSIDLEMADLEMARPRAVETNHDPDHKYWRFVFYVALGLGFLAKGPLAWIPLLTVISTKLFVRDVPLARRFWFVTGILGASAIVCSWGIPALNFTSGDYFRVGIGRHVVERSFNVMEGHGANSWNTYLAAIPFYFFMVFISFFPWSIKLPALTRHLWRRRDAIDNYLISGILIIFIIMTGVMTKLPHYTLPAFPLLSLLLARHIFDLRGSPHFARRVAVTATVVSLAVTLIVFPLIAPFFPAAQLFKLSRNDLLPDMDFGNVDFFEPSVVWYFRGRVHGYSRGLNPDQLEKFMHFPGPRFAIVPTPLAQAFSAKIDPSWKTYRARGFNIAKGKPTDLTMILKQSQ